MKTKIFALILLVICAFACTACSGMFPEPNTPGLDNNQTGTQNPSFDTTEVSFATAYAKAQELGFTGTLEEFIALLSGENGQDGKDGKDGTGVASATFDHRGHLILYFTDGTSTDCGLVKGEAGEKGETGEKGDKGDKGEVGATIKEIAFDEQGRLIITLTDGTVLDPIELPEKEEHAHAFGEWINSTENANLTCDKQIYYHVCSTCNALEWRMGCEDDHIWNEGYSFDMTEHWIACASCSATKDRADHTDGEQGICETCQKRTASEGLEFRISDDGTYAIVTGYYGTVEDVYIPAEYQGVPVTAIWDVTAGDGYSTAKRLHLPASVSDASTDGVFSPVLEAFIVAEDNPYLCSIDGVLYNKDATTLMVYPFAKREYAFTIPNSVTTIDEYAFIAMKNLLSLTIPESVTNFGRIDEDGICRLMEVYNYSSLALTTEDFGIWSPIPVQIYTDPSTPSKLWQTEDGFVFYEDADIRYLAAYIGDASNLVLPKSCRGQEYEIASISFLCSRDLLSVTIPNSVTTIGSMAFYGCNNLMSVTIPNSVTTIGDMAFYECNNLMSVTIGENVASIGSRAFEECYKLYDVYNLSSLPITAGSSAYGSVAYYALGVYTDLNNESKIWEDGNGYVFYENGYVCYLLGYNGTAKDLTLPASCNGKPYAICSRAFYGSNITGVIISAGVNSIGSSAFYGCSGLTSIVIPDSVTSIGSYAFSGCSGLTSLTIPDSVTSIGSYAFYACSGLTSVVIGNGVTAISRYTFHSCPNLTSVIIPDSVTSINAYAFYQSPNAIIYTTWDAKPNGWDRYELPSIIFGWIRNGTTEDGYVWVDTKNGFTIVKYVGSLTEVTIPTQIDGHSVTTIYSGAFSGNDAITSVTIPKGVTFIGSSAFSGCSALASVVIPDSVTSIGYDAFYGCSGLTSIVIPDSVTSIGRSAFSGCFALASVVIPDSVTSIGYCVFESCYNLTSIVIPDSVTAIESYAFAGCYNLAAVYYTGTEVQWKEISIDYTNYNYLTAAVRYYYSEEEPTEEGNYWHLVEGKIVVW